jgi:uncharacterized membrane protein YtjA (UPF0391 family)
VWLSFSLKGEVYSEAWKGPEIHLTLNRGKTMLKWALIFLVVAIVAAVLGFGGLAGAAAGIAEILFYVFLGIFLLMLIAGLVQGKGLRT